MALYAIGDLHFSPQNSKPMDIFGWGNHKEKIFADWIARVSADDPDRIGKLADAPVRHGRSPLGGMPSCARRG